MGTPDQRIKPQLLPELPELLQQQKARSTARTAQRTEDPKKSHKNGTDKSSVLTTGDVARITKVAPRTAAKWIDQGLLVGYKIPGSRDRRVTLEELLKFMTKNDMPSQYLLELDGYTKEQIKSLEVS